MLKYAVAQDGVTSAIKSSGYQSHLIDGHNPGDPDGSYLLEMHQDLMKQE